MSRPIFRPRGEIFADADEGRRFDVVYFVMLVFGCLIALLGLLLNSPAVIIGAMLISPLMGPLLACGLALSLADSQLGIKAARNILLSVVETVAIATLATWISPLHDLTSEILARTNPNLMDLLIALFSGTAGTLALSSKKGALTILPGVAIATAVMPPLATIGFGIALRRWDITGGAAMLFITNLTAIIFGSAAVYVAVGFRPRQAFGHEPKLIKYRLPIALILMLVLAIPLFQTLRLASSQSRTRAVVKEIITKILLESKHRAPEKVSVDFDGESPKVRVVVPTAKYIGAEIIKKIKDAVSAQIGGPVDLDFQQVQLARASEEHKVDYVAGGTIRPQAATIDPLAQLSTVRREVEQILCSEMGQDSCRVQSIGYDADGTLDVSAIYVQSEAAASEKLQQSINVVSRTLNCAVRGSITLVLGEVQLEVRDGNVPTRDAISKAVESIRDLRRESDAAYFVLYIPKSVPEDVSRELKEKVARSLGISTRDLMTDTAEEWKLRIAKKLTFRSAQTPPSPKD